MQITEFYCDLCNQNKSKDQLTTFYGVEQPDSTDLCESCIVYCVKRSLSGIKLRYKCTKCEGKGKIPVKRSWTTESHNFASIEYDNCDCGPQ